MTTEHDAARIQEIRARLEGARHDRRLRHRRRHPGAEQLRRRRRVHRRWSTPRRSTSRRSRTSTPISAHVPVDFELHGCPIDKRQLLEVISAFLHGRRPSIPTTSVCIECKRRGTVCVIVAHGTPCLGPVTHAGCGAICPAYERGCYGCFGPKETPEHRVADVAGPRSRESTPVERVFRTFNASPTSTSVRGRMASAARRRSGPTTSPVSRARARMYVGSRTAWSPTSR